MFNGLFNTDFNSNMVRLKDNQEVPGTNPFLLFQFQYGSIKSRCENTIF